MTSQPEKLFRDKLENFQRSAPSLAWDRIEANLDKSSDKKLWMKIAAGLLLLAVAGFFAWTINPIEEPLSLTKTDSIIPRSNSIEKNISKENSTPAVANQTPVRENVTSKHKTNIIKNDEPTLVEETMVKTPSISEPSESVAVVETNSVKETSSRTIVYTADEVNAKFLRKKSSSEATSVEKKSSSIQKLMGLAYTIKNPDNGIGDLRQKKDEILALNFLTKEDKTNKEKN